MVSYNKEILNEKLREEFEQTYSENDIYNKYCEEYDIIHYEPDNPPIIDEEDFKEFKDILFEEFKEERL